MLSEKMVKALNGQLNAELYSAYLYLSMASWLQEINLPGFVHWMECQATEEMTHAGKFYKFITERGGRAVMAPIDGPPTDWNNPVELFEAVLAHERKVTGLINDLVDLAIEERDHATNNYLQWFVAEQVEEEASVDEVLQQLKLMGDAQGGLFMLDKQLAARKVTMPPGLTVFA